MERTPVTSSSIRSIGHDGQTLEVEFTSGEVYRYHDVPTATFTALRGAESIGKHFHAHIKGGGFRHTKKPAA